MNVMVWNKFNWKYWPGITFIKWYIFTWDEKGHFRKIKSSESFTFSKCLQDNHWHISNYISNCDFHEKSYLCLTFTASSILSSGHRARWVPALLCNKSCARDVGQTCRGVVVVICSPGCYRFLWTVVLQKCTPWHTGCFLKASCCFSAKFLATLRMLERHESVLGTSVLHLM